VKILNVKRCQRTKQEDHGSAGEEAKEDLDDGNKPKERELK